MRKTTVLAMVSCAAAVGASLGGIVQGTELPPYQAVTNQLATTQGVVFSSLNYNGVTFTELIPGTWGVQGCEPWSPPSNGGWFNSPIFVEFVDPANGVTPAVVNGTVTAMWGDGGGDLDAVDLRAYDLSNNLIATQTFSGTTFTQIQITGVGIHRVEFWANTTIGSPTSDTGFDWISFPTPQVPAPGGLAVLGLGALAARRRHR